MKCAMTISVAMLLLLALTGVVTATASTTPRRGLRALFDADADLDVDLKTGSVGYAGTVTTPFYSGSVVWGASASGPGGPSATSQYSVASQNPFNGDVYADSQAVVLSPEGVYASGPEAYSGAFVGVADGDSQAAAYYETGSGRAAEASSTSIGTFNDKSTAIAETNSGGVSTDLIDDIESLNPQLAEDSVLLAEREKEDFGAVSLARTKNEVDLGIIDLEQVEAESGVVVTSGSGTSALFDDEPTGGVASTETYSENSLIYVESEGKTVEAGFEVDDKAVGFSSSSSSSSYGIREDWEKLEPVEVEVTGSLARSSGELLTDPNAVFPPTTDVSQSVVFVESGSNANGFQSNSASKATRAMTANGAVSVGVIEATEDKLTPGQVRGKVNATNVVYGGDATGAFGENSGLTATDGTAIFNQTGFAAADVEIGAISLPSGFTAQRAVAETGGRVEQQGFSSYASTTLQGAFADDNGDINQQTSISATNSVQGARATGESSGVSQTVATQEPGFPRNNITQLGYANGGTITQSVEDGPGVVTNSAILQVATEFDDDTTQEVENVQNLRLAQISLT